MKGWAEDGDSRVLGAQNMTVPKVSSTDPISSSKVFMPTNLCFLFFLIYSQLNSKAIDCLVVHNQIVFIWLESGMIKYFV